VELVSTSETTTVTVGQTASGDKALNVLQLMRLGPVIPVIVIDDLSQRCRSRVHSSAGGVRVLEITLRTAAGLEAIAAIARDVPEAIVGVARSRSRRSSNGRSTPAPASQ
jgi:hypothetical protein